MAEDTYIVTAAEMDQMQPMVKKHFLNRAALRQEKDIGALTGLNDIGIRLVDLAAGDESTEHHLHYHEEECLYVLEGEATARVGADSFILQPGDFMGCRKSGLAHSLKNHTAHTFRYLAICHQKEHDVSDYPLVGKRLFRNKGLTWNLVDKRVIDRPFGRKV